MSDTTSLTDEQAMWRVQCHCDTAAFDLLVNRWQKPLQSLCCRMLNDVHRAEDLVQEAFVRTFQHRARYLQNTRFSTWIWQITLNLCRDELRKRKRRPVVSLDEKFGNSLDGEEMTPDFPSKEPSPCDQMTAKETHSSVRSALSLLPDIYKEVVVLRHFHDLKFAEIASVLDIPEGTVKSRMSEALSRLHRSLAHHAQNQSEDAHGSPTNSGPEPIQSMILQPI